MQRCLSRMKGGQSLALAAIVAVLLAIAGCGGSSSVSSSVTATPTFAPVEGTYSAAQSVTVADVTQGTVLYCTTDGTTPTTSSPKCAEPIIVSKSQYLQAIAVAPGKSASTVASAGYTINLTALPTPAFSPAGGTYTTPQSVTISDTNSGANIYYSTDGSTPSASSSTSTLYTGPITISKTTTLSAVATASGYSDSGVASAVFALAALPAINNISPTSANVGGSAFALTVNGANFAANSTVYWGNTALATTYVSALQLTAAVPASLLTSAGTVVVTVNSSLGASSGAIFAVNSAAPTISSLSPSSANMGDPEFTLTINGSNFDPSATVSWGATPLARTYVSSAQLTAVVPASLIAAPGTANVTVTTSSGGTSSVSAFTIKPLVPQVGSLSPDSAIAGGQAFTLTVIGSNFISSATVNWGATALSTTFVSSAQLTAAVPDNLITTAGSTAITVSDSGGKSSSLTFTVNPATPTLLSLQPTSAVEGGYAFTLTVNGTSFGTDSTVYWGDTALATTYVNSSQLTAQVSSTLLATSGNVNITVKDSVGASSAQTFPVTLPGAPALTKLSAVSVVAGGGDLTLTVTGANFIPTAKVYWNTTALSTTFGDSGTLTATVPATLTGSPGSASITVQDTLGTSSAISFAITAAAPVVSPNGGSFAVTRTVTISDAADGATIYYTTDDSTPSVAQQKGTQYTGPITITASGSTPIVVNAVASSDGVNDSPVGSATFTLTGLTISGTVSSGSTPIAGATINVYAAGASGSGASAYGTGSAALPLAQSPVTTDSTGYFALSYDACPTTAQQDQMFVMAAGGEPGGGGSATNTGIALMTALGTCDATNKAQQLVGITEVSTIASAYALQQFMKPDTNVEGGIGVGSSSTNYQGLKNAFATVGNLVNITTGQAWGAPPQATWHTPGVGMTPAYTAMATSTTTPLAQWLNDSTVPTSRINTLANILATCVDNATNCGTLWTDTTTTSLTPANTLQAALNIAQNPGGVNLSGNNLNNLWTLSTLNTTPPYSPALTTQPNDFTLALTYQGAGLGRVNGNNAFGYEASVDGWSMAIDSLGNILAVGSANYDVSANQKSSMVVAFNSLGAPLTSATTVSADGNTIVYGGFSTYASLGGGSNIRALVPEAISVDANGNPWILTDINGGEDQLSQLFFDPVNGLSVGSQTMKQIDNDIYNNVQNPGEPVMAFDPTGNLWILNGGEWQEYEPGNAALNLNSGNMAGQNGSGGDAVSGLLFDSQGNLWGNDAYLGTMYQISTTGTAPYYTKTYSTAGAGDFVHGAMAADGAGNVYGCYSTNQIGVFNLSSGQTLPTTQPNQCYQVMAVDGDGHLWGVSQLSFGDYNHPAVLSELQYTSGNFSILSPAGAGYNGTSTGNGESNTIVCSSPEGSTAADCQFAGMAVDGSGNLWVMDRAVDDNKSTSGTYPSANMLVEYVGLAAPVSTPTAAAVRKNGTGTGGVGQRP